MAGSFVIVLLASALLTATGVLMESGVRAGAASPQLVGGAMMLAPIAASFAGTLILVVVLMVASTIAAALRQRRREFALLRAVGATGQQVRSMITGEVLLVFAVAGPLGALPGLLMARLLTPTLVTSGVVPAGFDLTFSPLPVLATLVLLVPIGLLAARLAGREAVATSPTAAVRQSDEEPSALGRGRRITAAVLGAAGLVIALVPFVMPGMMGSALGSTSAFLLVAAGALAGPMVVAWMAEHALRLVQPLGWASGHLAMANARGFSRRLSTAIVPLALLLALGTVQSAVNKTAAEAAVDQLSDGLRADLVVDAGGVSSDRLAQIAQLPGVRAAVSTGYAMAEVKVESDDDDFAGFDSLSWEQTGLRVIDPGTLAAVIDPQVSSGSLADLDGVDTVAIGRDATFGTGKGVGDTIDVRYASAAQGTETGEVTEVTEVTATIVAVYDRALGFGAFFVGDATTAAHDVPIIPDVILIQTEPGAAGSVGDQLDAMGLPAQDTGAYIEETAAAGAGEQDLSTILLLALLAFIALAAANTLAMLTAQRSGEFSLLRRTGATGRQVTAMVAVESAFVMLGALAIGTLAVLPALVGASYGLLNTPIPTVDWGVYGGLAAAVAVIAVLTIVPVALRKRA